MTESEMKAIREMFREANETLEDRMNQRFVGEIGKAMKAFEDRMGDRFVALETGIRGEIAELRGEVAEVKADVSSLKTDMEEVKADVKTIAARLDVSDADVRDARVRLALLAQAKG